MVTVRTPLRISFVGGGSDLDAFVRTSHGAVVSTTIDKYVYVTVTPASGDLVHVRERGREVSAPLDRLANELVRETVRANGPRRGLRIEIESDLSIGGTGLGTSSALLVGLVHALRVLEGGVPTRHDVAREAARLEIDVLGRPIGRQDHYASALGGLQLLRFGPGDAVAETAITLAPDQRRRVESSLMLFKVAPRGPAEDVLGRVARLKDPATLVALRELALRLYGELTNGFRADALGEYLSESWRLKRALDGGVTSEAVDRAVESARSSGALGAKLLGAGGGGFLLVYAPRERQARIRAAMADAAELPFALERRGSEVVTSGARG